jgi:hypothetical protein
LPAKAGFLRFRSRLSVASDNRFCRGEPPAGQSPAPAATGRFFRSGYWRCGILRAVPTPDPFPPPEADEPYFEPDEDAFVRPATGFWALGGRLTWVSALVLTIAPFTDWYAGPDTTGPTLAVIGWHTGVLGKLVFFIGLTLLALVILGELGFELPPTIPESLVVIALGSLATIFVLIRLISIPDSIPPPAGRGIGIWISLLASLGVIVAGLLRASEEL